MELRRFLTVSSGLPFFSLRSFRWIFRSRRRFGGSVVGFFMLYEALSNWGVFLTDMPPATWQSCERAGS